MVGSTSFSRVEDYNILKLFLQLGPDWGKIKSQMNSSRSKDSLRKRWVRLQEGDQKFLVRKASIFLLSPYFSLF